MGTSTTASTSESAAYFDLKVELPEEERLGLRPVEIRSPVQEEEEGQDQLLQIPRINLEDASATPESASLVLSPSPMSHEHAPEVTSPPPTVMEPAVPDPFILDDPEDPMSEGDSEGSKSVPEEISLTSAVAPTPTAERVNAELPPLPSRATPSPDSEEEEEETPDMYLPALTAPTMFLPIPNVRLSLFKPLTWWLSKNLINYSCIVRQIR